MTLSAFKSALCTGLLTLGLCTATLHSQSAEAAFVATDWKVSGDNKATLDTDTGIEWLDLSETRGASIQYVLNNLDTLYSGWRLPTQSEVQQMMRNFFAGAITFNSTSGRASTSQHTRVSQFENLFSRVYFKYSGDTYANYFARGMYLGDDGNVKSAGTYRQYRTNWGTNNSSVDYYYNVSSSLSYFANNCTAWDTPCYSVWLVSDGGTTLSSQADPTLNINNPNAPINNVNALAPSTMAAFGLFVVMALRRRNK